MNVYQVHTHSYQPFAIRSKGYRVISSGDVEFYNDNDHPIAYISGVCSVVENDYFVEEETDTEE